MRRIILLSMAVCLLLSLVAVAPAAAAPVRADRGAWAPNVAYVTGDTVTYNGQTYQCRQSHTSLTGWEPPNVPALWLPVGSSLSNTPTRTPTRTNTPTRTSTPTATNQNSQLDLTVTSVRATGNQSCYSSNFKIGVAVTIQNTGSAAVSTSFVVDVNGVTQSVASLGAGQQLTLWFNTVTSPAVAKVDSTNVIAESNENNNQMSAQLATLTPPVNCTPTFTPTNPAASFTPTFTPTRTPTSTSTRTPTVTPTSGGGGSCSSLPQYVAGTGYSAGQHVQNVGNEYVCNIAGWCSSSAAWAYAPGTGTYWTDAWSLAGPCTGGPTNTPTRTNTPPGPTVTPCTDCGGNLPKHVLVGYWHNFDNGSGYIQLRNVSSAWDVVIVAFAEPTNGATGGTMGFTPYNTTTAQFQADIAYLHGLGKKVLISIGGANGTVQLTSTGARDNFVNSMKSIISTYGFDGMDIDFEGQSLILNAGDSDFTAPTTPVIVNTISAIRSVRSAYGSNFILTMAPETFFVQLGYSFYGGTCSGCDRRAGAFLPVIYGTRDILTWLQVQDYNSGSITALDNQYYSMGNADFHSAMLDMTLNGFTVAGTGKTFPALRADQVALGIPASQNAGNGFLAFSEVQKALNYIVNGQSYGGAYVKRSANATALRGVMTWSINWDAFSGFVFSGSYRSYLNGLP
jgi:chitinase